LPRSAHLSGTSLLSAVCWQLEESIEAQSVHFPAACAPLFEPYASNDFIWSGNRLATAFVAKQVAQRLLARQAALLRSFVEASARAGAARGFAGNLFEPLAIRRLLRGGKFRIRDLRTGAESTLELPSWTSMSLTQSMSLLNIKVSNEADTSTTPAGASVSALGSTGVNDKEAVALDPKDSRANRATGNRRAIARVELGALSHALPSDDLSASMTVNTGLTAPESKVDSAGDAYDLALDNAWSEKEKTLTHRQLPVEVASIIPEILPSMLLSNVNQLSNLQDGHPLMPITDNFESFDFFVGRFKSFQMTVDPDHTLKVKGVKAVQRAMNARNEQPLQIFFVCPSFVYDKLLSVRSYEWSGQERCPHDHRQCQQCASADQRAQQYALLCDGWDAKATSCSIL